MRAAWVVRVCGAVAGRYPTREGAAALAAELGKHFIGVTLAREAD